MCLLSGYSTLRPTESGISGPIDMLHYHIRPYTVRQNFWDLKPMTLSPNVKDIKSRTPMMEKVMFIIN